MAVPGGINIVLLSQPLKKLVEYSECDEDDDDDFVK